MTCLSPGLSIEGESVGYKAVPLMVFQEVAKWSRASRNAVFLTLTGGRCMLHELK